MHIGVEGSQSAEKSPRFNLRHSDPGKRNRINYQHS